MYVGSNNKVYHDDGSKVMTASGRQVSKNSMGMIISSPHLTDERLADPADEEELRELIIRRQ